MFRVEQSTTLQTGIVLQGVTKTYKMGEETIYALRSVDLKIEPGEFVAIMGPSGSGKTTLANMIGGLDTPDTGKVIVDDQDLSIANDTALSHYRNKKIGFVFQTFNLQRHYTALENVAIPLIFAHISPAERHKRAEACLNAVGLNDRKLHKPNELSGGQQQRVAIARALVNDPTIILADEPTGNLDSKKGNEIITLLRSLQKKQKITLIIITHDPHLAKQADRVITIQDGEI